MQSDREVLELAAKAAGLEYHWVKVDGGSLMQASEPGSRSEESWNPLADDGDALRLAVKLSMEVYVDQHPEGCDCTEVWSTLHPDGQQSTVIINHDDDANAATRRAIVRAAAEIGATQPSKDGG